MIANDAGVDLGIVTNMKKLVVFTNAIYVISSFDSHVRQKE